MFKLKSYPFIAFILALRTVGLVGCAVQTPIEPTSTQVPPTETPAPIGHWEQVSQMQASNNLRMAAFLDENTGITGGPNMEGMAHTTSDGGQTWAAAGDSSGCLFGLEVIDARTMWECHASDVRVTTDGGQTWSDRMRGRGQPGCKISAIDAETAWVISPSQFIVTHDGGVTREPLDLPGGLQSRQVAAISFRSQTDGTILDAAGKLYSTTDGGQTWKTLPPLDLSKFGELGMALRANTGQPYAAVLFFDADYGLLILSLAAGDNGTKKVVALRTADGGQTWTEEAIEAPYGTPYLTRDGKYLTMVPLFSGGSREVTLFHYSEE